MARGLDHVVHAVADLDAAASLYERCGFQVGPRNRHPWGTHNRLVQFPDFFIEILTVGEPARLGDDGLSQHFGRFQQAAIARGDGLSMLIVSSDDAEADAASFARAGIGSSPVLPFSREAIAADGSATTIGFALAFARDPNAPHAGFATCAHRNPQAFWNTRFQQHRNGATRMAGVVFAAPRPADHAAFLRDLTACETITKSAEGVAIQTSRGTIDVWTDDAFARQTGVAAASGEGAGLRALRFAVPRLTFAENILHEAGIASHRAGARLVVPPRAAFGATLLFEEETTR